MYIVRVRDNMFGTTMWQVMPKLHNDLLSANAEQQMFAQYYAEAQIVAVNLN